MISASEKYTNCLPRLFSVYDLLCHDSFLLNFEIYCHPERTLLTVEESEFVTTRNRGTRLQ